MPALQRIPVLVGLSAVVLSACTVSGCELTGAGSQARSTAYDRGLAAGRQARQQHPFGPGASHYDIASFCVKTAVRDFQKLHHSALSWTAGFERGCLDP